ncbi:hypothetical protein CCHR01_03011 [Colletotrichum chrysophilum]|uniref:Uncharacterized protein n=1 Tax=Colletotrichum chrysophilum TaxID=1836956 RepID=A0AAD9AW01_9PEZI|nr:hypothetical protein CCHR01_03011 [Colletotrichum chrysophilum]
MSPEPERHYRLYTDLNGTPGNPDIASGSRNVDAGVGAPNSHRPFPGHPLGCTTAQARKPGLAKITDVSEIPVITYLAGLRVLIPLPFPAKALYERERKKEGLKGSPPPPTGLPKDGSDVEKGCEIEVALSWNTTGLFAHPALLFVVKEVLRDSFASPHETIWHT